MKTIIIFSFLQYALLGLDLKNISTDEKWKILQEKPIKIEQLSYQGFPISRASKICEYNMLSVANLIQDLDNYPNIFKRVTHTQRLSPNIVHIVLDMPFPFAGRDYIVQFSIEQNDSSWTFSFSSVKDSVESNKAGYIRLTDAAGLWKLDKISSNTTLVTYTWNGQLLGNFPEFGLEKAWITQGNEVLEWLTLELSKKNNS
tara:strand:- start:192 stop:794 length:603 start_codon:yes stop_codon:yes gene_type:complete